MPAGKYNEQEGQIINTICLDCPIGTYMDVGDGTISTEHDNENDCRQCEKGKYQDQTGQTSCDVCVPGQYRETPPSSAAYDSSNTNNGNLHACKLCAFGQYENLQQSIGCKNCPSGKYQDVEGLAECKLCQIGRYLPTSNSCTGFGTCDESNEYSDCKICSLGQYQDEIGSSSCKNCGAGKYQPPSRSFCANGYYPGNDIWKTNTLAQIQKLTLRMYQLEDNVQITVQIV